MVLSRVNRTMRSYTEPPQRQPQTSNRLEANPTTITVDLKNHSGSQGFWNHFLSAGSSSFGWAGTDNTRTQSLETWHSGAWLWRQWRLRLPRGSWTKRGKHRTGNCTPNSPSTCSSDSSGQNNERNKIELLEGFCQEMSGMVGRFFAQRTSGRLGTFMVSTSSSYGRASQEVWQAWETNSPKEFFQKPKILDFQRPKQLITGSKALVFETTFLPW